MKTWFTADLHLGHDKVAQYRGFPDHVKHDEMILDNLRDTLKKGDQLWALGDVSGFPDTQSTAFEYLVQVAEDTETEMHLVSGNHDGTHPSSRMAPRRLQSYGLGLGYTNPFSSIQSLAAARIAGERALLCHFPYEGDHTDADRHVQYRPRDLGKIIIHGHTHATTPVSYSRQGSLQLCVSVDAWDMKPVSKDTLTTLVGIEREKEWQ